MCYLFNVILLFKFFSHSSVCLCARLRKGQAWGEGSPIVKCKDARLLDLVSQTGANFGLTEGLRDGNPNIFTHADIA